MEREALLFDLHRMPWVERIWRESDPAVRREVIRVLAEMARANLRPKDETAPEVRHES